MEVSFLSESLASRVSALYDGFTADVVCSARRSLQESRVAVVSSVLLSFTIHLLGNVLKPYGKDGTFQ